MPPRQVLSVGEPLGWKASEQGGVTFYELLWQGENCGDAADLEEALSNFQEMRPEGMSWEEVCSDPQYSPTICRYRSFEAYLDNEDALELIEPSAEMLQRFQPADVSSADALDAEAASEG